MYQDSFIVNFFDNKIAFQSINNVPTDEKYFKIFLDQSSHRAVIGSFLNAQTFLTSPAHHHFIYHPQCASNHRSVSDYIEFCYFEKAKNPW